MKLLTQKQHDELWGETGPYSQVQLIIETRILDDRVSRIFLLVEVSVNPFTYRLVKKNRDRFQYNEIIQQLLDHADYRGQHFGYVSCAFQKEYTDESVMQEAQNSVAYAQETVLNMHRFVLEYLHKK